MKKRFLMLLSLILVFSLVVPVVAHNETYEDEVGNDTIVEVTIINPLTSRVLTEFIADSARPLDVQIEEHMHLAMENLAKEVLGFTAGEFSFNFEHVPNELRSLCTHPSGHSFTLTGTSQTSSSAGSHSVLIRITYVNEWTGWISIREEQRTCYMTLSSYTFYLECMHCGASTTSVVNDVSHTHC